MTTATRSEALPDIPTVGEFVPGYEASRWFGIGRAQEHARRDHRQAQQGDQRGPRRSQDEGAACRSGRHGAVRARPPTSASSSPTKPRSGARWSSSRASSRSDPRTAAEYSITSRYAHALPRPGRRKATEASDGPALARPPRQGKLTTGRLTRRDEGRPVPRHPRSRRTGGPGYDVSFHQLRTCRPRWTRRERAKALNRCAIERFTRGFPCKHGDRSNARR